MLKETAGPTLVSLVNWVAESLDPTELSIEQVVTISLIVETTANTLWRHFPEVMLMLFKHLVTRYREAQGNADDADDLADADASDAEDSDDSEDSGSGYH